LEPDEWEANAIIGQKIKMGGFTISSMEANLSGKSLLKTHIAGNILSRYFLPVNGFLLFLPMLNSFKTGHSDLVNGPC
jgi:hypothetical protein